MAWLGVLAAVGAGVAVWVVLAAVCCVVSPTMRARLSMTEPKRAVCPSPAEKSVEASSS